MFSWYLPVCYVVLSGVGRVGQGSGEGVLRLPEWGRVLNGKGINVEELELSVLMGHGYKWMAAASTVIYE